MAAIARPTAPPSENRLLYEIISTVADYQFTSTVNALVQKVPPVVVERALATVEGVLEACVVGVPDDEWGQRIAAAVSTPGWWWMAPLPSMSWSSAAVSRAQGDTASS